MNEKTSVPPCPVFAQSGVIPFARKSDQIAILLISNRSGTRWVIPKGLIEGELTARESASKEAYEEGGITGKTFERPIGEFEYRKWGGVCRVEVFLFEVERILNDWPEADMRFRAWLTVEAAAKLVEEESLGHLVRQVPLFLDEALGK